MITSIAVDIHHDLNSGKYDYDKEGGFIFTNKMGTYIVKNDFNRKNEYRKEYNSDSFFTYRYLYNSDTSQSKIIDEYEKEYNFSSLKDSLDKKHSLFNDGYIYKVDDIFFIQSEAIVNYRKSLLFYFSDDITYITEFGYENLLKIKILDGFIK